MKINFTNFPKEFKILKKELNNKFNKIGNLGQYILGEELKQFEKNIQKLTDNNIANIEKILSDKEKEISQI